MPPLPPLAWLQDGTTWLAIALACTILAALAAIYVLHRRWTTRLAQAAGELRQCLESQQLLLRRDTGLRTILTHTNSIFFMLDQESRVLHSEGMGLSLVKRPAGGNIGMKFLEAHPERTDLQQYFEASLAGEPVSAYVPYSGGTFRLLTNPLKDEDGAIAGLAGILLDVTELEQARARITESEALLRSILDNAPYSMVVHRISDGKCLEANKTYLNRMGITAAMLPQFDAVGLTGLSTEEALALRRHIAQQGGLHGQEAVVRRPDGGTSYLLYSSVPITYANEPSLLIMTVDITAQKEALRAKAENEEKLRAIFNNSPLGIFRMSFDGGTEEVNTELVRMLGYADREELLAVEPGALFADPEERHKIRRLLLNSPSGVRRELMLRRKDDSLLPVAASVSLQFDDDGRPTWVHGALEDLSFRKEQERELQFWAQRFEIANTAAQHIFYDYDLCTGVMQWIGAVQEVLGYDRHDLDGPIHIWERMLHPDDAPEVLPWLAATSKSGEKFDMDYRLLHKDGHHVYVHDSGIFEPGADGRPERMLGIIEDITARKQAELALAANEKKYRTLFESAQDTIIIMDGQIIIDCNPSAMELIGCTREEMAGRTLADFSPPAQADGSNTVQLMRDMLSRAEGGERLRFDWEFRKMDGTIVPVETTLAPLHVGGARYLLALARDVSEHKEAERNLRLSEEKFSKVYTLAPYSISITRLKDSIILDVNAAFELLTGYSRQEALGKSGDELRLWSDPASRAAFLEQLQRNGTVLDYEFTMRRKDGVLRSALNSCQSIEINGERCSINIVRDITELKLVQQAMVQTEKMVSLGGLAAGMAHEINNPLGIISQSAQGVLRRFEPGLPANLTEAKALNLDMEAVHEYMRRRNILRYLTGILEAGERATVIVRNMLSFSRKSDSGIVDQDVGALVEQAVSLAEKDYDLKKKYDFRRIDVRLELAEAPASVPCIPSEIEQVLLNLLRNAAQAMAEAGTAHPAITVRAARDGHEALIEVQDNGPGIPAEQLDRVFEPFYTTKKVGEGTGLGLSVSYFIITTTHRGRMSVDSQPGRGTRFSIRLPLARAARPATH